MSDTRDIKVDPCDNRIIRCHTCLPPVATPSLTLAITPTTALTLTTHHSTFTQTLTLTLTLTRCGTTAYMSPERIKGESYAYPSDIWSFAIVALEGACGAFPYPAFGNYFEVVKRIVDGPLPTEDPAVQVRGM